jgi:hypothetical protein
MAATPKPEPQDAPGAPIATYLEAAARVRALNERLIEGAMAEGSRRLDAYEKALTTLVELTDKACATQLDWLSALAQMHSDFIRDVSTAYTTTVRVLLG